MWIVPTRLVLFSSTCDLFSKRIFMELPRDCWSYILAYSDSLDLRIIACCSTELKLLSDSDDNWSRLCEFLWRDKQNSPLERWQRLDSAFTPQSNRQSIVNISLISKTIEHIEKLIVEWKSELNIMNPSFKSVDDNPSGDLFDCKQTQEKYLRVIDQLRIDEMKLKDNVLILRQLEQNSWSDSTASPLDLEVSCRESCPVSRAVKAEWIKNFEFRLFELINRKEEIVAELQSTSYCKERSDSLESELSELQSRESILHEVVLRSINSSVDVSAACRAAASQGSLLTWKQSYSASLKDSRRCVPTREELRELGDVLIVFRDSVERARFVQGGFKLLNNRGLQTRFGTFEIHENEFFIPEVGAWGRCLRTTDWGWEFSVMGIIRIVSYDRASGCSTHELVRGRQEVPPEVEGPLMSLHRDLFGLYRF